MVRTARSSVALADKIITLMNLVPGPVAAYFRSDSVLARVLRPIVNRVVPSELSWIVVRTGAARGIHLLIYPKTEKLFWTGMHEVPVQQMMTRFLQPGMTYWDIGAHIGFFTFLASRLVGAAGQVHAFEPMSHTRARLLASVKMNSCNNIIVHDCALSATSGKAMLYASDSAAMWTLVANRGQGRGEMVRCSTLDEVAQSTSPPDLIKVDAEGAEVEVLRGGLQLLSTARPALIVEFSDDTLLAAARALLPAYTFEPLTARHWLLQTEF